MEEEDGKREPGKFIGPGEIDLPEAFRRSASGIMDRKSLPLSTEVYRTIALFFLAKVNKSKMLTLIPFSEAQQVTKFDARPFINHKKLNTAAPRRFGGAPYFTGKFTLV